ncbi:non-ribosomal peptide synthetase/type I polyketide synthase [Symbioplanes lichenis]|uniref:non-ribosomal peptide synthetase/type I polyketide synthase n=1 Tax=Symbioplanes lichenis TaxID=1629072 RepID=UPI002738E297|nr:MupA/Atu3671 family FMN-dependent luciferase-like monooxygenase [Actinoplanes lichenis]
MPHETSDPPVDLSEAAGLAGAAELAMSERIDVAGRRRTVVYVAPLPGVDPADLRRAVTAAASGSHPALPDVVVVTSIPRTDTGDVDWPALHRLPVATSAGAPIHPAAPPPVPTFPLTTPMAPPAGEEAGPQVHSDEPAGPPVVIGGDELPEDEHDQPDLVRALLHAAATWPDRGLTLVEADGTRRLSYPELAGAARRILTGLRAEGLRPGDPVILHAPTLTGHFTGLWACVLGGLHPVAVAQAPTYERRNATLDKLFHAWRTLGEPPVLSSGTTVGALTAYAGMRGMRVLDLDAWRDAPPASDVHLPEPGDVATLQLSSGSTSRSKIVPLTHRGLVRYARGSRLAGRFRPGGTALNWLPLDHVAALVMTHLGPVLLGSPTVHVATPLVLADPLRWLDLLEEHRAAHSWAPNFGFKLVAEALRAADGTRTWDLRHVRSLINAGEQCTEPVMRRFAQTTERFGLGARPLLLAWGMAETCTVCTYQPFDAAAVQRVRVGPDGVRLELDPSGSTLLSMGPPVAGTAMRVAGPDGRTVLPERHIGRLQVRSERVLPGYLHNPEADREAFPDGDWFDTGDLAYLHDGRMTITGRAKEVIIVNGVHYFCHEIEDVAGEVDGVAVSNVAALGVPDAEGIERIAVLLVPSGGDDPGLLSRVRAHLAHRMQITGAEIVAVPPDRFDKTTSGKIQRAGMRARWLAGGYDDVRSSDPRTAPDCVYRATWHPRSFPEDPHPVPSPRIVHTGSSVAEMLALARRIAAEGWTGELVTVGSSSPEAAVVASLGASLAAEHSGVRAWHLDVPDHDDAVIRRALTWRHHEPVIAWRGRPLVRRLERVPLALADGESPLLPGSRWLVTGGRGGVAAALLGSLPHGLDLLITGRTPVPADDPALVALRTAGHRIQYAALDITDPQALNQAVDAWGGALDGVLHLAGQYQLEPLATADPDHWHDQLAAKVQGSLAVSELLARWPDAALIAFSSLVAQVPVAGASAYAAGNRFLEAWCEQLARDRPVWCLAWGAWRGTGISRSQEAIEDTLRRYAYVLEPAQAAALTHAALRLPPGQLYLGVDPAAVRFRGLVQPPHALETAAGADAFGTELPPPLVSRAAPVVSDPVPAGSGVVRRQVDAALRAALPGGVRDDVPFYDAGLDSVAILRAHALLERALGRTLPPTLFFEHGTPAALRAHLGGSSAADGATPAGAGTRDGRVAVIGIALRFPDAADTGQYWRNLLDGRVSIRRFDRAELLAAGLPAALVDDERFVPASGALDDIAGFDAAYFGISPGEAALMDPQHRKFLEVCHEALEDGGYAGSAGPVALFAGSGMHLYSLRTYLRTQLGDVDPGDQVAALRATIGNETDFLASRVAYKLGLTGPAVSVQTACSTALVAVHQAVRALQAGDAELALAGAAALHVPGVAGYRAEPGSILSPTGVCRPFDTAADGTVGGNGVAALLLKPLDRALADGDTVHAVITGTAVNNDGSDKAGYAAPSVGGHAAVIRRALAAAGLTPDDLGYLEAHGTGTPIGDPIEIEALRTVFGERRLPLTVGAVKGNIGHLDTCAGMAGLIKAILAVRHGQIPPVAGLRDPIVAGALSLPTSPVDWPAEQPRRAGVSALGVGGTNAHVIVEQGPAPDPAPSTSAYLVPLSAPTSEALTTLAGRLADRLDAADPPRAEDVLMTLGAGRRIHSERLFIHAATATAAARALRMPADSPAAPVIGPVVFALAGQGADVAAAIAALQGHPAARDVLRECAAHHERWWGTDLLAPVTPGDTAAGQPALVALQLAQARFLHTIGVRPEQLIGHSAGEYAALCLAGALSVADTMYLAGLRGHLMQHRTEPGAAVAVFTDDATAGDLCAAVPGLTHTVRNGPENQVLSGSPAVVDQVCAALDEAGIGYRRLAVSHAFHSAAMDPILDDLTAQAATLDWQPLQTPLVSGFDGTILSPGTLLGAGHVRRHTRDRANFRAGVETLLALDRGAASSFIELGPGAVLTGLGTQWPDTTWIPTHRRDGSLAGAVGELFRRGIHVDWSSLAPGGRRIPLPTMPFRADRHWAPAAAEPARPAAVPSSADRAAAGGPHPMPNEPVADPPTTVILDRVRHMVARHLGTSADAIPPDRPFFDLGADSLLMINLLRDVEAAFGVRLGMRELFEDHDTAALLTKALTTRMTPDRLAALAPAPPPSAPASPPAFSPPAPSGPAGAGAAGSGAGGEGAAPAAFPPAPTVAPAPNPVFAAPSLSAALPSAVLPSAAPSSAAPSSEVPSSGPAPVSDDIVRSQLELMSRFTDLMAQQLQARPTAPIASAAPHPTAASSHLAAPQSVFPSGGPSTTSSPAGQLGPRPLGATPSAAGGRLTEQQQRHVDALIERYTARTAASKRIAQQHRRRLADSRAVVGFRRATKEMLYPIAARSSRGSRIVDVDGNEYVDITMGFGTLLFGHDPDFVTDAVRDFLDSGMRFGPRSAETGEVADLLCELTGMDRAAFATTGTEANSGALRIARAFTGRSVVVTFEGSYHGHFDPVLSRSVPAGNGEKEWRTVPVSAGIPESAVADMRVLTYGDPASLETIAREAGHIAAVVIEPVPSRHPDRRPVAFVRELRELCDRHGIVLIFDEMLTGFRPHLRGAQGVFGVRADLATYGKVLGGGYPVGAIAGRADIMDWVDGGFWQYGDTSAPPQETTFFGGTYLQHPVSMVAAKAVLSRLRDAGPELQESLNRRTAALAGTLNDFFAAEDFPLRTLHFGSLFRFASTANLDLFFHHLLLAGVHVWEWRNFFLSTAHTDTDLAAISNAVKNSLTELRAAGFFPRTEPAQVPRTPNAVRRDATGEQDSFAQRDATVQLDSDVWQDSTEELDLAERQNSTEQLDATAQREPAELDVDAGNLDETRQAPGTPEPQPPNGTLDFSLYFFGDYPRESAPAKYQAIVDAAVFGDRHGLHAVWLPERHFDSFGGIFPDPAVLAAALATRTERIGLRAGCVVLPLHDPILVAEQWSMVDNLSNGRVALGCASGWHARDFVLAPQAYGNHRDRMYESIERIRELWSGAAVEATAGDGSRTQVQLFPRPVQAMPEFYTAVVGNPDSYRRAGAAGLGVITNLMAQTVDQLAGNIALYRRARAEAGLDPEAGRVVLLLHTYLGDDGEQTRAEAFEPFCDYLRSSLALFGQLTNSLGMQVDLDGMASEDLNFVFRRAYERYTTDRALIGSPREAAPLLTRLTALGVNEIGCFVDFGIPPEKMLAALPHIEKLTIAPAPSPAQRAIWHAEQSDPGPAYTESAVVRLTGALDVGKLRAALDLMVRRHPMLRATFPEQNGEPRLEIGAPRPLLLPVTGGDESEVADAETAHRFDLAAGPLFEPRLIREGPERYLLVLRMHHLVIDTLSAEVLTEEISQAYQGNTDLPAPHPLPAPVDPGAAGLEHWTATLAQRPPRPELPVDRPRPPVRTGAGDHVRATIGAGDHELLTRFCREQRVTPYAVLVSALAVALRRLTGEPDQIIGAPVADRPAGAERVVGAFLSTVPLRVPVADQEGFADLVRTTRTTVLTAHDHRAAGLPAIVAALGDATEPGRTPLFDVVIEFDRAPVFAFDLPGIRSEPLPVVARRAPFDLTLVLTGGDATIDCRLDYATDLFDEATARRVLDHFRLALHHGLAHPAEPLSALPRLTATDAALLARWQDGGPPAPDADRLLSPLDLSAGLTVHGSDGVVTGSEVRRRAAAIAPRLVAAGAGPGRLVGVHLPRGADAVATMLAVFWTGAGYVPLDPAQPTARLAEIARAAEVVAVVGPVPLADLVRVDPAVDPAEEPPEPVSPGPADIAYVLYTSGSTGRPKGCRVPHAALANTVAWWIGDLGITAADRLSWYCSPGFDASCAEVWPAVRAGASLHPVPDDVRLDPEALRQWLVAERITVAMLPTPMGELLLGLDWSGGAGDLRHLVVGGDRLHHGGPAGRPFALTNIYGPTEATVAVTTARIPAGSSDVPAIGRPVPGMWVRVLDEDGRPVPPGVAGEIWTGGVQLADGYLGAPEETADRFVRHDRYGPAYRTGDVGRWRGDGHLEFLHRNDAQVQIRGFRVEPGEVEHHLRRLPSVREAAVLTGLDHRGDVQLTARVVPTGPDVTPAALAEALAARLPAYMIPAVWTLADALPTTVNGKLDRAAPRDDLEARVHAMWCAETGRTSIGPDETFFAAGGHSLSAIRLLNAVRAAFGRAPAVRQFLAGPTIRHMADFLRSPFTPVDAAPASDVVRSAPAAVVQARQRESTLASDVPSVLTIAVRFSLRGDLDVGALTSAVTALVERHPALRTRYAERDGVVLQEVLRPRPVSLPIRDADPSEWDAIAAEWAAQGFDLDAEPGFRVALLASKGIHELLFAIHHGICDGWSLDVMTDDLGALYRAALTGEPAGLPALDADFIDFATWERDHLADPATRAELRAWAERFPNLRTLALPTDHPRTADVSRAGAAYTIDLSPDLMRRVRAYATSRTSTPYAVLAAAFAWLAHQLTGRDDIPLNSTVANRPDARFDRVVGIFASAAWLIVPTGGAASFDDLVARATEANWQMLARQSVPSRVQTAALGLTAPERVYFATLDEGESVLRLPGCDPAPAGHIATTGSRGDQAWQLAELPGGGLRLEIIYAVALFDEPTVAAWAARYLDLLHHVLAGPAAPLPT